MSELHPDYLKSVESARYAGRLEELLALLLPEAWRLRGRWATRVLPRGAFVQVRVRAEDMRRELRVARREGPTTDEGRRRWRQECAVFLKKLGPPHRGGAWHELGDRASKRSSGIACTWLELYPGETEPGFTACADCKKRIRFDPAFNPNRCDPCALAAGDRYTRDVHAELAASAAAARERRQFPERDDE